jgi:hypothetical protein
MLRPFTLRLVLPALLAASLVPAAVYAQSDNSQSVAEAARKARAQKKNAEKPAKVITDETLDVRKGDVQSAAAEQPRIPGSPETQTQPNSMGTQTPASPAESEKGAKERAALKDQIKQVMNDLDLLQRKLSLDQDAFYSNLNYAKDEAGKANLDAQKQQISDKQQELDKLKAQLAALPDLPDSPAAAAPPKS